VVSVGPSADGDDVGPCTLATLMTLFFAGGAGPSARRLVVGSGGGDVMAAFLRAVSRRAASLSRRAARELISSPVLVVDRRAIESLLLRSRTFRQTAPLTFASVWPSGRLPGDYCP